MKKRYKIIIALTILLSCISLGTCFALFTVNFNVSASGSFTMHGLLLNVEKISLDEDKSVGCIFDDDADSYVTDINNPTNIYGIKTTMQYPGAICYLKIDIVNIGDLAAILDYENINQITNDIVDVKLFYSADLLDLYSDRGKSGVKKLDVGDVENIYLRIYYDIENEYIENNIETDINIKLPYIMYDNL